MQLLVTGGAGFIGRTLVRKLVDAGHRVDALDNFSFSQSHQTFEHPNLKWHDGDTRNFSLVKQLVDGKDAVMHLAAPSSFLMHEEDDLGACSFTLMGYKTVMEAVRRCGVRKVVWASTSAVYEGNPVPYDEGMALRPPDSKAGCKHWCELEARRYSERYGITSIGMRPFSVYGRGEDSKRGYANVISLFAWAMMHGERPEVWGDGKQTRDYIYVTDAADAFIRALEADIPTQQLNVGTGIETTFNDVIRMIAEELGIEANPTYVPVPIRIYAERLWADMTQAQSVLGFRPKVTLREGIRDVINYARSLSDPRALAGHQHYWQGLPEESRV
jgi:UDP-glucose 4-epimerase